MSSKIRADIQASDKRAGCVVVSIATQESRIGVELDREDARRFALDMARAYTAAYGDQQSRHLQPLAECLNEMVRTLDPKES